MWIKTKDQKPPIDDTDEFSKEYKISIRVLTFGEFGMRFGQYYYMSDHWNVEMVSSSRGVNVEFWQLIERPNKTEDDLKTKREIK